MLIRRSHLQLDLRTLPLDGFDMFLLSRLEGPATVSLGELLAIVPRDTKDTMQRVEQLVRLGVLEFEGGARREPALFAREPSLAPPSVDTAATLRPPRAIGPDEAITLRPPPAGAIRTVLLAQPETGVEFIVPSLLVKRWERGG